MEENEKLTPVFDWETGEFITNAGRVLTAKEMDAVAQIIQKAQRTERGAYLIYANTENMDLNHKYGSDVMAIIRSPNLTEETKVSEIKRAVREAIIYDPWIEEVYNITVVKTGTDEYDVDYEVKTIFDATLQVKGVRIYG